MPRGTSPQYFVEAITAARRVGPPHPYSEEVDFLGTTAWEYQVKWAEFPEEQNTWEPPLNLDETCEELVASFWEHVDIDTFTTALEGFEVSATSEWIGLEQDRFWREHTKAEVVAQNKNPRGLVRKRTTRKSPYKPRSRKKRKVDVSPSPPPVVEPPLDTNATVASPEQPVERDAVLTPPQTPEREPWSGIMTYEPKNIQSASTLRTKHRLGSQRFAPGIPRYISPPPSSNKDTATTVLDANMEASAGNADDFLELTRESLENGDGLYAPGEDPFASMRNEMTRSDMGEPIDDHALDEAAEEFLHIPETSEIHTTSVTWSGQFTITAPGYIVSQLVTKRATLIDSTSPTENDLPTLDSFLLPSQDLNLCKFYEVRDLVIAVPAFKPTQQFARLVAEDEDESFRTFVQYLSHKEQAALLPAVQKNQLLGYLFILPPSASNLLTALGSTSHSDQPPCLVVALVFLIAGSPPPRSRSVIPLQPREKLSQVANMHTELAYRFALCVTALPEHVLRYTLNHPSVVWSGATKDDLDTAHLRCALSKSRQGIIDAAGAGSKAGTVFIHVRALPFVHSLPDIVELRSRPEVRFYSYGTHPSVPPKRWGHRPIFLLGGIVTFSVAALTGDPWGLLRTIRRIAAHPLWECYLLPQIFGLALRLNEQREDSGMEELGDSGLPLALDRILDAVLEGQVALLCAPGSDPAEYLLKHLWSICRQDREQLLPIFRTDKDNLLERCRAACDAAFPDPAASFETAAEVVRADVRRMQTQPLLVETYRRYVVIDVGSNDQQDGIEWQDIGRFSFNDALDSSE